MPFLPLLSHATASSITLWADVHLEVMEGLVIFMYPYVGAYTAHQTRGKTQQLLKGTLQNILHG